MDKRNILASIISNAITFSIIAALIIVFDYININIDWSPLMAIFIVLLLVYIRRIEKKQTEIARTNSEAICHYISRFNKHIDLFHKSSGTDGKPNETNQTHQTHP